jgi:hypothetical protein
MARSSCVHSECTGQDERRHDSPSKQGGDEAMEMGSGGGVSGDGGVLRWSPVVEERS